MISRALLRNGWRPWRLVTGVVLVLAAFWITRVAWLDIITTAAADEEQSHIFLVPIVAIWMAWARRVRARRCAPVGTWIGPLVVAIGVTAWILGYTNRMQSVWHFGAVATVAGSALTVLGTQVLARFLPVFLVLVFLVPVPQIIRQEIGIPLQTVTAIATQIVLESFGVMVDRSGNLLQINSVEVAVAEACNGMRMVFALALVAYAFVFGMPLRNSARLIFLLLTPVAAIVCNVLRLIPTVLGYAYGSHEVGDFMHDVGGWLMLPIAFFLLLGVVRVLQWALIPVTRYTLAYQ